MDGEGSTFSPRPSFEKQRSLSLKNTSSPPATRRLASGECGRCGVEAVEPRLLSCLHSFCTRCLIAQAQQTSDAHFIRRRSIMRSEDYMKFDDSSISGYSSEMSLQTDIAPSVAQTIYCSTCGAGTRLPNGDVHNLPLNHTLQNKIMLSRSVPPPCDLCTIEPSASYKCQGCDIFMCSFCSDMHRNFCYKKIHKVVQPKSTPKVIDAKVMCEVHGGCVLEGACVECGVAVCVECRGEGHAGHGIESLGAAGERARAKIQAAAQAVKPAVKETTHLLDAAKHLETRIKDRCREVENEVESHIQSYHEAIEDHRQALHQEIAEVRENKLCLVNEHLVILEQKMKHTENALAYAEDLLKEASDLEVLGTVNLLMERMEWCCASVEGLPLNIPHCVQFLPQERAAVVKSHQLYGVVTTQSVSPLNSFLRNESLLNCRQHKRADVVLVTKDCNKQVICHGGERVVAELRYKDSSQRLLPVSIMDVGDGTYVLSFTPDSPGNLTLSVKLQGEHIQGSPYKVSVFTFRPHSGVFHCCTFCSSGGNKNSVCGCGCKMPGGYKGCGHGHEGHPGRRHWSCCGNVLQNSECSRPLVYQFSL